MELIFLAISIVTGVAKVSKTVLEHFGLIKSDLTKLHETISREELKVSITFFQTGVGQLNLYFEELSKEQNVDVEIEEVEKSDDINTTSIATPIQRQRRQRSIPCRSNTFHFVEESFELRQIPTDTLECARKSFEKAIEKAIEAFHSSGNKPEEKLIAMKIRIASAILCNLNNAQMAIHDIMQCLNEMNSLQDAQKAFSGPKRYKEWYANFATSVLSIHVAIAEFVAKYTDCEMAVIDWPMIKCSSRMIHPIHHELGESQSCLLPWDTIHVYEDAISLTSLTSQRSALNSKGELLAFDKHRLIRLHGKTGTLKPYNWSVKDKGFEEILDGEVRCMTVDKNDNIYLISFKVVDYVSNYMLTTYDPQGSIVRQHSLQFLRDKAARNFFMATTLNGEIVVAFVYGCEQGIEVDVCFGDGEIVESFRPKNERNSIIQKMECLSISSDENIMIITYAESRKCYKLFTYTKEGRYTKCNNFSPNCKEITKFNQITCTCETKSITGFSFKDDSTLIMEEFCAETGKFQSSLSLSNFAIFDKQERFIHHFNGTVALLSEKRVIYVKKHKASKSPIPSTPILQM